MIVSISQMERECQVSAVPENQGEIGPRDVTVGTAVRKRLTAAFWVRMIMIYDTFF